MWSSFIWNSLRFPAWGMCQRIGVWHKNPSLGEFGKEPEGSPESDRYRFTRCLRSKVQIQYTYYNPESEKVQ